MKGLIRTPKVQMAITLLLIFATAFFHVPSNRLILNLFLAVCSAVLADILFIKIRKTPSFFLSAAFVSGTIIGLLSGPNLPWYEPVLAAVLAMLAKNFIRLDNRHIFNPAGFGLLATSALFQHNVSWWAVSFQKLTNLSLDLFVASIILLSPAIISVVRLRRFRITILFLIVYTISTSFVLLMHQNLPFSQLLSITAFDPTVLFFSLVMLPEPMTTPHKHVYQIFFGATVALISTIISLPQFSGISDPLIASLLFCNLIFIKKR